MSAMVWLTKARLGRDPERRVAGSSGKSYVSFSVATEDEFRKGEAVWHRIEVWGEARGSAVMNYLGKGSMVNVIGHLRYFKQKIGDKEVQQAVIKADTVEFIGGKRDA